MTHSSRIVIVNDDPTQLLLLARIVERAGHHVLPFAGPAEALLSLRADPNVDLVIVDLHMPVIDGWRFCRLLRSPEYADFNSTPILVVSATFAGTDVEAITADLGANAFLPIPLTSDSLLGHVSDLLAGNRPPSSLSVLVVEDDDPLRELIRSAFERHGYDVQTARSAEEASHLVARMRPDVLILDYHLPGIDGGAFLRDLRKPGDSLVAIVITGDPDPDLPIRALRNGAMAFVRKPFDMTYLVDLAQKARRERSMLRTEEILEGRTKELQASEARYRSLFNTVPEAVLVLDRAGRILQANRVAEERLARGSLPLVGTELWDIAEEHHRLALKSGLALAWLDGAATFEATLYTPDESPIHAEITGRVTDFQDADALLIAFRDITERKRIEEERRRMDARSQHAQKLESLGILAGGIAHDFNNLLMGVLGNASLALADLDASHAAAESVQQIEVAARRAAELTGQILTYSGKGPVAMKPLSLNALVGEMGQLLEPAVSKKCELKYSLADDLPSIQGDSSQLSQVAMNLIMNASDALCGDAGVIRVSTHSTNLGSDALEDSFLGEHLGPGPYVALEVIDTGCGMDAETLKRMFDPFYTTKIDGRGLGLAAVLGIVRGHRGAITVSSTPDRGSTITVYLPVADERPEDRHDEGQCPSKGWTGTGKILIVDDERAVRRVVQAVLQRAGYEVLAAEDGHGGLDLFKSHQGEIRATILDLTMPGLDGDEVLAAIRAIDPNAPVILSSGYTGDEVLDRVKNSTVSAYLQKPYKPAELLSVLQEILGPQRSQSDEHRVPA